MSNLNTATTFPRLNAIDFEDDADLIYVFKGRKRRCYTMTITEFRKLINSDFSEDKVVAPVKRRKRKLKATKGAVDFD